MSTTGTLASNNGGAFERAVLGIAGTEAIADRSGALVLAAERTLIVSDLHLEKGSAFAVRGVLLPPYDTRETLSRLADVIARYAPARVIALGDSLHDRTAGDRLGSDERAVLRQLQSGREWIWVTGNHDPEIPPDIGGEACGEVELGGVVFRHQPSPEADAREVAGHLHPAARVLLSGAGLRGPCFVASAKRIVLPAFGAFTGGLNVLDEAFEPLFSRSGFGVHVLGRKGIYPVARASLGPD
jgi:DNA ligase-associated metallophosphoesterase